MTLSSLHDEVDLCYAAAGDNIARISRAFIVGQTSLVQRGVPKAGAVGKTS